MNTHGKTAVFALGEETVNLLHVIVCGKLGGLAMISNRKVVFFFLFLPSYFLMYCIFIQ